MKLVFLPEAIDDIERLYTTKGYILLRSKFLAACEDFADPDENRAAVHAARDRGRPARNNRPADTVVPRASDSATHIDTAARQRRTLYVELLVGGNACGRDARGPGGHRMPGGRRVWSVTSWLG